MEIRTNLASLEALAQKLQDENGKEISIINAAQNIGTIAYELLTRISARVKRLYYLD